MRNAAAPRNAKRSDPQIEELPGAYSGERVSVGLKSEGESERYDTRLSIAAFCQPGKLSRILANEEASERGLYGRFRIRLRRRNPAPTEHRAPRRSGVRRQRCILRGSSAMGGRGSIAEHRASGPN